MSGRIPDDLCQGIEALPALPAAVVRLLGMVRGAQVSVAEVARVVDSDPALTAHTLRVVNSPLYGIPRPVKTAQHAVVLLGIHALVHLTLTVAVVRLQNDLHQIHKKLPFESTAFRRHSLAVALATEKLARRFKMPRPSEALVAGLMHDIGKLVLLAHHGKDYAALLEHARLGEKALGELEQATFGFDHARAGSALCEHWGIPGTIAQAVATHHSASASDTLGGLVGTANDLVKTMHLGFSGNRFIAPLPGQPGRWHQTLIVSLPADVVVAEETLGCSRDADTTERPALPSRSRSATRPYVQLQIADPTERAVLAAMLVAMGFEPKTMRDADVVEAPIYPVALLADTKPSTRKRQAFEQLDILVPDYAAFRADRMIAAGRPLDVYLLWAWLSGAMQRND